MTPLPPPKKQPQPVFHGPQLPDGAAKALTPGAGAQQQLSIDRTLEQLQAKSEDSQQQQQQQKNVQKRKLDEKDDQQEKANKKIKEEMAVVSGAGSSVEGASKEGKQPIASLTAGEESICISLTLISAEYRAIIKSEGKKQDEAINAYSLLCTDGHDFVQVTGWRAQADRLLRLVPLTMKEDTLLDFTKLEVLPSTWLNDPGNKGIGLHFKVASTVHVMPNAIISSAYDLYYEHLKMRVHNLDPKAFNPVSISSVVQGENFLHIQGLIKSIKPIQKVTVEGRESSVMHFTIDDGTATARISAWNLTARFLERLLKDMQGEVIMVADVDLKKFDNFGRQFNFGLKSKIAIKNEETSTVVAKNLSELAEKAHLGKNKVEIFLQILKKPFEDTDRMLQCTQATDGQVKCQLFFPREIELHTGDEILVSKATVQRVGECFNVMVHKKEEMFKQQENTIGSDLKLDKLFYPAMSSASQQN